MQASLLGNDTIPAAVVRQMYASHHYPILYCTNSPFTVYLIPLRAGDDLASQQCLVQTDDETVQGYHMHILTQCFRSDITVLVAFTLIYIHYLQIRQVTPQVSTWYEMHISVPTSSLRRASILEIPVFPRPLPPFLPFSRVLILGSCFLPPSLPPLWLPTWCRWRHYQYDLKCPSVSISTKTVTNAIRKAP